MAFPAAAIASIIGAGASQSNSIADTLYSNHMNYVNMNNVNASNEAINERQLQFAREMWDLQNEYNLPKNEYQRLVDAGINPHLYYAKNSAGAPAQLQHAPQQIPMQAPAPANRFDFPDLSNIGASIADAELKEAQVQNLQEDTRTRSIDNMFEYDKQLNSLMEQRERVLNTNMDSKEKQKQIDLMDEQITDIKIEREYARDMYQARNDEMRHSADLRREQMISQQLNNQYQRMVNDAFPAMSAAQTNALNASSADAYALADLHYNMSATECEKQANLVTERQLARLKQEGLKIDNENQKKLGRANLHYIRAVTHKVRDADNFIQNYSPLVGAAGSTVPRVIR